MLPHASSSPPLSSQPAQSGALLNQTQHLLLQTQVEFSSDSGQSTQSLPPQSFLAHRASVAPLNVLKAHISFRSRQLKAFPLGVAQLTSLYSCDLSFNQIYLIPEDIGACSSLTYLALQWNLIESIPNSIARLHRLKELHLWSNRFANFPPAVGYITSLAVLDLNTNDITMVPSAIGALTMLTYLNLSFNKISSLHHSIGNLRQLRRLILNDNALQDIPPSIGDLKELAVLFLQSNALSSLPKEIGQLSSLSILYLQHNHLVFIPSELANNRMLKTLNITSNSIAILPTALSDLNLETLLLDDNPLTVPPINIASKSAQEILLYLRNFDAIMPSRFSEDLGNAYNNPKFHDIVFKIQEKRIFCHKIVLATRCPYFQTIFLRDSKKVEFEVKKYSHDIYSLFLKYLYTGDFQDNLSMEELSNLKTIASEYRNEELSLLCKAVRSSRSSGIFQPAPTGSILGHQFSKALNEMHFFDVMVSGDQKLSFKCHKMILTNRCSRLRDIIESQKEDASSKSRSPSTIRLSDLNDTSLKHIIQYIYGDHVSTGLTLPIYLEIYASAHSYNLVRMQRLIEGQMKTLFSVDNVCAIYELAVKTNSDTLRVMTQEYIISHFTSVSVSAGFHQLSPVNRQTLQASAKSKN